MDGKPQRAPLRGKDEHGNYRTKLEEVYAPLHCERLARCALTISIQRRAAAVAEGWASSIEQQHTSTLIEHDSMNNSQAAVATDDVTASDAEVVTDAVHAEAVTDTMHASTNEHADVPTGGNMPGSDENDTGVRIGDRTEVHWTKEKTRFTDWHHRKQH